MTDTHRRPPTLWLKYIRLVFLSMFCMGLVGIGWIQLNPFVETNYLRKRVRLLQEVIPSTPIDQKILNTEIEYPDEWISGVQILTSWSTLERNSVEGESSMIAIIEARTDNGYSGAIRLLVAVKEGGRVLGVRVLEHQETPGLGDRIDRQRSDWIEQFAGIPTDPGNWSLWYLRQDGGRFEKISGATITSRAMVQTVALVAQWWGDFRR